MQDPVKLLISFPQSTDIEEVAARLRSDYTFPQQVKIVGKTKLSCSFETMADLLEIDFINIFGATATKVINSRTFSQEMNFESSSLNQPLTESDFNEGQSSLGQFPNGTLLDEEIKFKTVVARRTQRLTSLEDQVIQEQKIRQLLTLYNSKDQIAFWQSPLIIQEKDQKLQGSDETQASLQSHKEAVPKKQESIWGSLLGGLALTSVLVGGFKLMRMVIG